MEKARLARLSIKYMKEIRDYAVRMSENIFAIQREREKMYYEAITPELSEKIRQDLKKDLEKFPGAPFEEKCVTYDDVYTLPPDEFYAKIRNANVPMASAETKEEAVAYVAEFLVNNLHIMLHVWEYGDKNAVSIGIKRVQRLILSLSSTNPRSFCDECFCGNPCFEWMESLKNIRPYSYYMVGEIMDAFETNAYSKLGFGGMDPCQEIVLILSHRDVVLPPCT